MDTMTPELLPEAQEMIKGIIVPGMKVLEFGSGYSTIWFAELGCDVTSVENDRWWYDTIQEWIIACEFSIELHFQHKNMQKVAGLFEDSIFDIVLVDCDSMQRPKCIEPSINKVKPNGWLILDDSHWASLKKLPKTLTDWEKIVISGMHTRKDGRVRYAQTSFYKKIQCS